MLENGFRMNSREESSSKSLCKELSNQTVMSDENIKLKSWLLMPPVNTHIPTGYYCEWIDRGSDCPPSDINSVRIRPTHAGKLAGRSAMAAR